jgi:hypothetical protein
MAYWHAHGRMGEMLPVLQVAGPAWVEICHGLNVANRLGQLGEEVRWNEIRGQFMR